jgi:hypothetical protein
VASAPEVTTGPLRLLPVDRPARRPADQPISPKEAGRAHWATVTGVDVYRPLNSPSGPLCSIGNAHVYQRTIAVNGLILPLPGAQFALTYQPATIQRTSSTGMAIAIASVVLAVATFWWTCGIGLLFLLGLFGAGIEDASLVRAGARHHPRRRADDPGPGTRWEARRPAMAAQQGDLLPATGRTSPDHLTFPPDVNNVVRPTRYTVDCPRYW